jgi:general secretion pathway protein C
MKRLPLAADFILFMTLCASLAYWGMQFFKPQSRPAALLPQQAEPAMPRIEAAAGLFGGRLAGGAVATNFQLKGVIAAGPDGVAILAADGKPPQALSVGMEAAPGVTVKEVNTTYVLLGEGGMIKRVDLPENAKGGLGIVGLIAAGPSGAPMPALAMNLDHVEIHPSMPTPAMNIDNDQTASEQLQHRRPRGIGPAAFGAEPTSMPAPTPPPAPQPVGPNELPTQNPMRAGGHSG